MKVRISIYMISHSLFKIKSRPTCLKISKLNVNLKLKENNNKIWPKLGSRQATSGICTPSIQNPLKKMNHSEQKAGGSWREGVIPHLTPRML